jgi:hypothetical protein
VEVGGVHWWHDDGGVDKQRMGKLEVLTGGGVDGGSSWGRRCGLDNALSDGLHAESKQGKGGQSTSEGPQPRWRVVKHWR